MNEVVSQRPPRSSQHNRTRLLLQISCKFVNSAWVVECGIQKQKHPQKVYAKHSVEMASSTVEKLSGAHKHILLKQLLLPEV